MGRLAAWGCLRVMPGCVPPAVCSGGRVKHFPRQNGRQEESRVLGLHQDVIGKPADPGLPGSGQVGLRGLSQSAKQATVS